MNKLLHPAGAGAKLTLSLPEALCFLYPSDPDALPGEDGPQPSNDSIIRGSLTLSLKRRTPVPAIRLKLVGQANVHIPDRPYEIGNTIEKRLEIVPSDAPNHMLEAGEHKFMFTFIVPARTAPYERGAYGRIRHYVRATVKGIGVMGADLRQECFVELAVNPGERDRPAPGIDSRIEGFVDDLGPYLINIKSPSLTVAGLSLFTFALPSPSADLKLSSISARIEQAYKLYTVKDHKLVAEPAPRYETLFDLRPSVDGSTAMRLPRRPDSPPRSRWTATRVTTRGSEPIGCQSESEIAYRQQHPPPSTTGRPSRTTTPKSTSMRPNISRGESGSASDSTGRPGSRPSSRAASPGRSPHLVASPPSTPGALPDMDRLALVSRALEELSPACIPSNIGPNKPMHLSQLARIPNADWVRASTMPGTITPLEVSHKLIIDIEYLAVGGIRRVFTAVKRLHIASCSCMMQTLSLPQYTEEPAGDNPAYDNDATELHLPNCVSQMELAELVKQQAPSLFASSAGAPTNGNEVAPMCRRPNRPNRRACRSAEI